MNTNQSVVKIIVRETLVRECEVTIPITSLALMTSQAMPSLIREAEKEELLSTASNIICDEECRTVKLQAWMETNPDYYLIDSNRGWVKK